MKYAQMEVDYTFLIEHLLISKNATQFRLGRGCLNVESVVLIIDFLLHLFT
jgi:hypothetical protein